MAAMNRVQESAQLLSAASSCNVQEDAEICVVSLLNLHIRWPQKGKNQPKSKNSNVLSPTKNELEADNQEKRNVCGQAREVYVTI